LVEIEKIQVLASSHFFWSFSLHSKADEVTA
jgi:hypothetical protein